MTTDTPTKIDMLAAALDLAAKGVPVFSLCSPTAEGTCGCGKAHTVRDTGKAPLTPHGHLDASTDPDAVRKMFTKWPDANIGVDLERGGLVDLAADSEQWLRKFQKFRIDGIVARYVSGGGDGHEHWWFRRPDGCPTERVCKSGEYDLMSKGYAVAPPSLHRSGRRYDWVVPLLDIESLPLAPDAVVAMFGAPNTERVRPEVPDTDDPPVRLDVEGLHWWRGEESFKREDGEIDRSLTLWWIAIFLRDAGASRQTIIDAIAERDAALGFNKYTVRRDGGQGYSNIADKLEEYEQREVIHDHVNGRKNGNGQHADGDDQPDDGDDDEPEEDPDASDAPEHFTDGGNAGFLVRRYGRDFRFVPGRGHFVWTGQRWARDVSDVRVHGLAQRAVRDLYRLAAEEPRPKRRKALGAHAKTSDSARAVAGMVQLARSLPGVAVSNDVFDQHDRRFLFNVENGTVDLRTGALRRHQRCEYMTKMSPVTYDADAECPLFLAFLHRVFAGNESLIGYVQRAAGYTLTGDTSERVMFICHGGGANGKSKLLEAFRFVVGDYGIAAEPTLLMQSKNDQHLAQVAVLAGARFVAAIETAESRKLDEATIKHLTGEDRISARFMRENPWDFAPSHKFWMATNHLPRVSGTDDAIWDRLPLIQFNVRIPEKERDLQLGDKLRGEAAGILAWMVSGAVVWAKSGLQPPDCVRRATADYRGDEDTLKAFIEDCCIVKPGACAQVGALYAAYVTWVLGTGEKPETAKSFGNKLGVRGFPAKRAAGYRVRMGLVLRPQVRADKDDA